MHQTGHGKGAHMDPRFVASSMLLFNQGWSDQKTGTRDYTAAELDAIADFGWPWTGLQRMVVTGLQAILPRRWQTIAGQQDVDVMEGAQGTQGAQDEQGPTGDPLSGWVAFPLYEPR